MDVISLQLLDNTRGSFTRVPCDREMKLIISLKP